MSVFDDPDDPVDDDWEYDEYWDEDDDCDDYGDEEWY